MIIVENKSLTTLTIAVGESYNFEPVFVYDMEYNELTDNTVVKYESKRSKIASVGEFGKIIGKRIGSTEINYMVTNPAFDEESVYMYSIKVNVIDPKDVVDEEPEPQPEPPVVVPTPDVAKPTTPVKPAVPELVSLTFNYLNKINSGLRALTINGLETDKFGRNLTDLAISYQVNLYYVFKELFTNKNDVDTSLIEHELNNFCCKNCECKEKLNKVLNYNASWSKYFGVSSKVSDDDRVRFNSILNSIITSTFGF